MASEIKLPIMVELLTLTLSGYWTLLEFRNELKIPDVKVFLADGSDCIYGAINRVIDLSNEEFEHFLNN